MSNWDELIKAINADRNRTTERFMECARVAQRVLAKFREVLEMPSDLENALVVAPVIGDVDNRKGVQHTIPGALRGGEDGRYHLGATLTVRLGGRVPENIHFDFAFERTGDGAYEVQCGDGTKFAVGLDDPESLHRYAEHLFAGVVAMYERDRSDTGPTREPVPPEQRN